MGSNMLLLRIVIEIVCMLEGELVLMFVLMKHGRAAGPDDKAMEIYKLLNFPSSLTHTHSFIQRLMLVCVCFFGLGATLQA